MGADERLFQRGIACARRAGGQVCLLRRLCKRPVPTEMRGLAVLRRRDCCVFDIAGDADLLDAAAEDAEHAQRQAVDAHFVAGDRHLAEVVVDEAADRVVVLLFVVGLEAEQLVERVDADARVEDRFASR